MGQQITEEDCLEELRQAADELGHTPSRREYAALNPQISAYRIQQTLDVSWNEAKSKAGLDPGNRGRRERREISADFFEAIDSAASAYWLGYLFCYSTIKENKTLLLSRRGDEGDYVERFAKAVDSEYAITEYDSGNGSQTQTSITNSQFVSSLCEYGLHKRISKHLPLPEIEEPYRRDFLRALLEQHGRFSQTSRTIKWRFESKSEERLETIGEWITNYGVQHYSLNEQQDGSFALNISSVYDLKPLYEACWPFGTDTTPADPQRAVEYGNQILENHPHTDSFDFDKPHIQYEKEESNQASVHEGGRQTPPSEPNLPFSVYTFPIGERSIMYRETVEKPLLLDHLQETPDVLQDLNGDRFWGLNTDQPKEKASADEISSGDVIIFHQDEQPTAISEVVGIVESHRAGSWLWPSKNIDVLLVCERHSDVSTVGLGQGRDIIATANNEESHRIDSSDLNEDARVVLEEWSSAAE